MKTIKGAALKTNDTIRFLKEWTNGEKELGHNSISLDLLSRWADSLERFEGQENAWNIESNKATINYAVTAVKSSLLVSGAGSVALLTFLGHASGHGNVGTSLINLLGPVMMKWGISVILSLTTIASAYVAQYSDSKREAYLYDIFWVLAMLCWASSVAIFSLGLIEGAHVFTSFTPPHTP